MPILAIWGVNLTKYEQHCTHRINVIVNNIIFAFIYFIDISVKICFPIVKYKKNSKMVPLVYKLFDLAPKRINCTMKVINCLFITFMVQGDKRAVGSSNGIQLLPSMDTRKSRRVTSTLQVYSGKGKINQNERRSRVIGPRALSRNEQILQE